jgi:hypothetical protein
MSSSNKLTNSKTAAGKKTKKPQHKEASLHSKFVKVYTHGKQTFTHAKDLVAHLARLIAPWFAKKEALLKQREKLLLDARPSSIFSGEYKADTREVDIAVASCDLEIATLRSMARGIFGREIVKYKLHQFSNLTATVATGVVNTVINVSPTSATDWASVSALFEEFRVVSGNYDFVTNMSSLSGNTTTMNIQDAFFAMVFDSTSNTALTSTALAVEYEHKALYPIAQLARATTVSTSVNHGYHHTFHWRPDSGVNSALGPPTSSDWQPVNNAAYVGYIKCFGVGTEITAVNVAAGIVNYNVEFRNRT